MHDMMSAVGAMVSIVGVLVGIRLMSSPRTAVAGNLVGAASLLGGVALTLVMQGVVTHKLLWLSLAIGAAIGCVLAVRVTMIQMPQFVALLNGLGGGASATVAVLASFQTPEAMTLAGKITCGLAVGLGSLTLSGSLVAAAKLARMISQRPVRLRAHAAVTTMVTMVLVPCVVLMLSPSFSGTWVCALVAFGIAFLLGVLVTLPIGGADMPITISLLNSLSGVSASIAGFAINDGFLVAVGAIVGAAGLILTRIMCHAMNRTLWEVLTGRTVLLPGVQARSPVEHAADEMTRDTPAVQPESATSIRAILQEARKVAIVPGYGMALAQAQHQVKRLMDALERRHTDVRFGIHSVAGRMPGHMHVLLAEADIPYDRLCEMNAINPEFVNMDLVIVVGANDVVNPAASTAKGSPIYGMPILRVAEARHVVVCNLDDQPGYAGVPNALYGQRNVTLLTGDAKQTLAYLLEQLDDARGECPPAPAA